jgi:hypothetical protein
MIASVLVLTLAASGGFDAAKGKAKEVESLKKTVSALIGDCQGAEFEEAISCEENLKKAAKRLRKGSHSIWLPPTDQQLIRYEGARGGKHRLLITPVFDAGDGHALTVGRPSKLDKKSGAPYLKFLVVDAELAPGVLESDIKRALRLGNMSIELVGSFGNTWSLNGKRGVVQGVEFKPTHIRFANARNGKAILDAKLK